MYDKKPIILGLVLFVGVATFPFWISLGDSDPMPQPALKAGLTATQCVESAEFMRPNHMKLLDQWRDDAVRDSNRTYISSSGQHFEKSLTKTCLNCHSNKEEFCERCHTQVNSKPYCWSCHLVPPREKI